MWGIFFPTDGKKKTFILQPIIPDNQLVWGFNKIQYPCGIQGCSPCGGYRGYNPESRMVWIESPNPTGYQVYYWLAFLNQVPEIF